ncbi:hypothetical protein NM688_g4437 [Phlebia brevispora]|uniref:Uncharacterized protein n=1 Tax=Phlebia brevispora TaxID=194682 RepID=A0ACC1T340_9APHY|nr:hypothetical protein NM688_g4437 [Phlebia brevispora]
MSFPRLLNGDLVHSSWSKSLPVLAKDEQRISSLTGSDLVPVDSTHMHDWCYLYWDPDEHERARRWKLLYTVEEGEEALTERREVLLRFQGFLDSVRVNGTGNQTAHIPPHKVIQDLSITAGSDEHAFAAQIHAVQLIRNRICDAFDCPHAEIKADRLYFMRRVYKKVESGIDVKHTLSTRMDPAQLSATVGSQWTVNSELRLGYQTESRKLISCGDQRFRKGDFVDVTAGVDVVRWKDAGETHCQVYLNLRRLIQLMPRNVQSVRDLHAAPAKVSTTTDFDFDDAEDEEMK